MNLVVEAVEIGRLGDIALDGRRMRTEQGSRRFELCLPAARDVNARAFFHENLGRRQANSGVSTSDDSDLSIEFRHIFLKLVGLNHQFRGAKPEYGFSGTIIGGCR